MLALSFDCLFCRLSIDSRICVCGREGSSESVPFDLFKITGAIYDFVKNFFTRDHGLPFFEKLSSKGSEKQRCSLLAKFVDDR